MVAVAEDGAIIAFEAKLRKWRQALHQAYRNLCFAHRSYVVLPEKTALIAARYEEEFLTRGVGLCYVNDDELVILREAIANEPLQPRISDRASLHVSRE